MYIHRISFQHLITLILSLTIFATIAPIPALAGGDNNGLDQQSEYIVAASSQ